MKNANPVSRCAALRAQALLLGLSLIVLAGCGKSPLRTTAAVPPSPPASADARPVVTRYSYEVVKVWPHDRGAFTQGLVFRDGNFIESTGLNGRSTLREVELQSGRVLKQVALAPVYFAEGVAVIASQVFQLTWQNRKAFVYDADTFQLLKEFPYEGEGWGLTTDGTALIASDGTSQIRFLDPVTFSVKRTLPVTMDGKPLDRLNELEFIHGEIFANIWQTDEVVRIDPVSGIVRGIIDFSGLLAAHDRHADTDVLNGIAYDPKNDRLFVTGKRWPRLFEVRLKARP